MTWALVRSATFLGLVALSASCGTTLSTDPFAEASAGPSLGHVESAEAAKPLNVLYAEIESEFLATGNMRLETAPMDAPYDVDRLVQNFERIALFNEYVEVDGRFVRAETPALLRRWEKPVRIALVLGPSASPAGAAWHWKEVATFTARLADLTGHDIKLTKGDDANFLVMILTREEQAVAAPEIAARFPIFQPATLSALSGRPQDAVCTAYAFAEPERPSTYASVMVVIGAEHPPLTRSSCIQEEMAQAMGLSNDSLQARPSLFNDSREFAFLTEHDQALLRMLYDRRLRPGMSLTEARPLLPDVASDAYLAEVEARSSPKVKRRFGWINEFRNYVSPAWGS